MPSAEAPGTRLPENGCCGSDVVGCPSTFCELVNVTMVESTLIFATEPLWMETVMASAGPAISPGVVALVSMASILVTLIETLSGSAAVLFNSTLVTGPAATEGTTIRMEPPEGAGTGTVRPGVGIVGVGAEPCAGAVGDAAAGIDAVGAFAGLAPASAGPVHPASGAEMRTARIKAAVAVIFFCPKPLMSSPIP